MMGTSLPTQCPHCGGSELFTRRVSTKVEMPLLVGLGGFLRFAKFDAVLCADCGHFSLFAEPDARRKVRESNAWRRRDAVGTVCPGCGYDLRATPDRCPECGLSPGR